MLYFVHGLLTATNVGHCEYETLTVYTDRQTVSLMSHVSLVRVCAIVLYGNVHHSLWTSCSPYCTTTTTTTTAVFWPFVPDYPGEPVPEETFTHSHRYLSSAVLYPFHQSTMIHSILPVQFMCLTVLLHDLSPGPLWSASWSGTLHFILHTFIHPVFVFLW